MIMIVGELVVAALVNYDGRTSLPCSTHHNDTPGTIITTILPTYIHKIHISYL